MRAKNPVNYYLILNVPPEADSQEIKRAYIKLARAYHPDKNRGNRLAEKRFQQINKAWQVLKNPEERRAFDKRLAIEKEKRPALLNTNSLSPSAPLKTNPATPIDIEVPLKVSLEDICLSKVKKLNYLKPIAGKKIKSSFELQIPLGAKTGTKLYFRGKGGSEGKKNFGDLYVKLQLSRHKIFYFSEKIGGFDLFLDRPVPFTDVIEGKRVEILSPYGPLLLKQPLSLEDGQTLKIKGYGLPKNQQGDKGDLFVKIILDYPAGGEAPHKIKGMSFERQKAYAREIKKKPVVYPKALRFQQVLRELKRETVK